MNPKATVFKFTSYQFEPAKKRVVFNYKTEFSSQKPLFFTETIILPKVPNLNGIPKELTKKLLEALHIIIGISYYKFYCATKITAPYGLSKKEADFFNTVYKKGLGEFFYKNKLNPKISPKFPFVKDKKEVSYPLPKNNKCLVGIGGGKDSIVSGELLKQNHFDIEAFFIKSGGKSTLTEKIISILGVKSIKIERILDSKINQLHQYNGHIPISAIYAFLGLLSAVLYRYSYVIVSNEHSSNFGNLKYKGEIVNHQWSKSFEFEKLLQEYVKSSISPDIFYFSLLRPFYEIRIVKMFAKNNPSTQLGTRKYFPYFSSCNTNFKINEVLNRGLWCGQCAKCVFVFTLLSAFLSKEELLGIFGKNLYQDKTLLSLFKDILGFGSIKPFDCVGTFQEAQTALSMACKKYSNDFIMRQLGNKAMYYKEVFLINKESNIPQQFKLLTAENVLILGYGKEGMVTKKYIKKYYPYLKIGVADANQGKNYLKNIKNYDIIIKTPGIPKEKLTVKTRAPITIGARPSTQKLSALVPYTTATNIFFSKVLDKNKIIGITGSKGKSTTSSLIYHILKTAGKDVELLGNIGTPMLGALLNHIPKERIFVLELSSAQLDDIMYSPDIAIVTNLFPEHMDYHGNVKKYYQAKKNIIKFQNSDQYFVHNEKTSAWLDGCRGKSVSFSQKTFKSNLIGQHNESNIKAAISVAEILHIPQEKIKKAIGSFRGLAHRLEFVGEFKGIKFYDDAISTTPESTIMAIKALKNIGTIFLGGQNRGYDFSQLEKVTKQYRIKNIVLFPDSGNKIIKDKSSLNILTTNSMREAVKFAYKHTRKGSVCLLSCASPSYSLWKNFEEKGGEFKKFVKELDRQEK